MGSSKILRGKLKQIYSSLSKWKYVHNLWSRLCFHWFWAEYEFVLCLQKEKLIFIIKINNLVLCVINLLSNKRDTVSHDPLHVEIYSILCYFSLSKIQTNPKNDYFSSTFDFFFVFLICTLLLRLFQDYYQ